MGKALGLISDDTVRAVVMSLLLGMTVAAVSDVFSPVREKIPMLTDLALCIWMIWIWLTIAFEICAGDLRTGYCVAAALGAFGWRKWLSPVTRPVFVNIWKLIFMGIRILLIPIEFFLKKIKIFRKKLFPMGEK